MTPTPVIYLFSDFVGSILWGFKFQIEIGELDFETGIWAKTYHNWAKIDDAGSPWIHRPRQSSIMLIGSIWREEFITGLVLGWFLIFLGGSDLNPNVQYDIFFSRTCNLRATNPCARHKSSLVKSSLVPKTIILTPTVVCDFYVLSGIWWLTGG